VVVRILKAESTTDLLLLDVTPFFSWYRTRGEGHVDSDQAKHAYPLSDSHVLTEDWQTSIDVVYEGERAHVDANNQLGSFVINGIQRARAGEPKVDVTFALDANGILNVSAKDQVTVGNEANATIKAEKEQLTEDEIDRMVEDAEKYRLQDAQLIKKTAYKTALEEALQPRARRRVSDAQELGELMDWMDLDYRHGDFGRNEESRTYH
jgi:L1 cell adhesion molecule like protein